MKKILLAFVLITASFLAVTGGADAHTTTEPIVITIDEKGFSPKDVVIEQGETVRFVNTGKRAQWPASNVHPTHEIFPEFDPQRGLEPGEAWEFTFDRAGQWRYHDHLFPQFGGVITVVSQPTATSTDEVATEPGFWEKLGQAFRNFFSMIASWFKSNAPERQEVAVEEHSTKLYVDDDTLYSYVKKFGPKQAVAQLQNPAQEQYGDCHQRTHKVGRFAYEIYGDEAFQQCSADCHSGCYHGATEAYFKDKGTDNLADNLKILCSSELNPFFSHQCLHGIGHGLMAWSNYELPDALKSCDLLPRGQESCYTGIFMENIVGALASDNSGNSPASLDGHYTNYLSDDPLYPCNDPAVTDQYRGSCYFLQTSRMVQLYKSDFAKVAAACAQAPENYQTFCFQSMGRDVGGIHRKDAPGAIKVCGFAAKGQDRTDCLVGAVQDSFWDPSGQDEALGFCKLLKDKIEKNACYQTVFDRAPQVLADKNELTAFCNKAETEFAAACRAYIK